MTISDRFVPLKRHLFFLVRQRNSGTTSSMHFICFQKHNACSTLARDFARDYIISININILADRKVIGIFVIISTIRKQMCIREEWTSSVVKVVLLREENRIECQEWLLIDGFFWGCEKASSPIDLLCLSFEESGFIKKSQSLTCWSIAESDDDIDVETCCGRRRRLKIEGVCPCCSCSFPNIFFDFKISFDKIFEINKRRYIYISKSRRICRQCIVLSASRLVKVGRKLFFDKYVSSDCNRNWWVLTCVLMIIRHFNK